MPFPVLVIAYIEYNLLIEVLKKAIGTIHGEDCFSTQSTSHWTCTLSKELLADTTRLPAKFTDYCKDPKNAAGPDIKKILIKHNREMMKARWTGDGLSRAISSLVKLARAASCA